jgi:hypothetical protein
VLYTFSYFSNHLLTAVKHMQREECTNLKEQQTDGILPRKYRLGS